MSQYKDIPQPTDQRNVSQADILTNYRYLSTPINVAAGVPNGIIPVDHKASGDNVANPKDGFHLQVSYLNRATPASLVNSINGQSSDSIDYSKSSSASAQKHFYNGTRDYPQSYLYALVRFSIAGGVCTIMGNAFNVSAINYLSVGNYQVVFTTALPDTNFLPIITCDSSAPSTPSFPVGGSRALTVNNFRVIVADAATGIQGDPNSVAVQVIEYF